MARALEWLMAGTDMCVLDSGTAVVHAPEGMHPDVELFLRECRKLHNFETMAAEPERQDYIHTR